MAPPARPAPSASPARRTRPPAPPRGPCACGGCGPQDGPSGAVGPGARALAADPRIKDTNLKQLRRIEGQVRGIASMVESDRYCADIITQVAAVRESLSSVARNLLRNHLSHCAARAMSGRGPERAEMVEELLDLVGKLGR